MESLINGRYALLSRIGAGGMGNVYLAEDRARGNALVALKQVRPEGVSAEDSAAAAAALIREFETLSHLKHPHLPMVHDFGRIEGAGDLFLSMDYVEGRDLVEASTTLDAPRTLALLAQICRALEFIHTRGLIHGDLKPDNILVKEGEGASPRAFLVDFGLAAAARGRGQLHGTLHFVSPEALRGEPIDRRADLYALGILLYRLCAGRCPFEGTARDVLKGHTEGAPQRPPGGGAVASAPLSPILGDELWSVITRLLEKDPARRYRSAAETLGALNRATGSDHPLETHETGEAYLSWAPIVGREKEIALFEAILDRLPQRIEKGIQERDATVLLVRGESGVGRSRFAFEAKRHAQVRGVISTVVTAAAGSPPFSAVLEALSLLGAAPVSLPVGGDGGVGAETARLHGADLVATSLGARAAKAPVVLVLDDAHLADEGTLAVLEALARSPASAPGLLLVLTYRIEEIEGTLLEAALTRIRRAARVEEIPLSPLSLEQTRDLLRRMLGLEKDPGRLAELLHAETSGNPFFIEEALRSLIEDGTISRVDLSFRADTDALTKVSFAAGVGEAIRRRLGRLSAAERRVMEAMSVAARPFPAPLLAEVAEMSPGDLATVLEGLCARGLAARRESEAGTLFGVASERTRAYLYDVIPWERRRDLHARAASALELAAARGGCVPSAELARHVLEGRGAAEALPVALEAAAHCARAGDGARAMELYRRAHELLAPEKNAERAEVAREVGIAARDLGRDLAAMEWFDRSLRAAGSAGRHDLAAKARLERANLFVRRGRMEEAIREAQQALELLAGGEDQVLLARAYSVMASALGRGGKIERSLQVQQKAAAVAEASGDRRTLAAALNNLGNLLMFAGRWDEGLPIVERSIALRREIGDRLGEMEATINYGIRLEESGDHERAIARLEGAAEIARALGDLRALMECRINLGEARMARGEHFRAHASLEEAVAVGARIGDDIRAATALDSWGASLRTIGDADSAVRRHEQALAHARRAGDAGQECFALASLALDHAAAGRLDEARDALKRAGRIPASSVPKRCRPRLHEAAAQAHLLAGAAADAAASAKEMLDAALAERMPKEEAAALLLRGRALAAAGDAAAAAALREAAERSAAVSSEEIQWRALAALAGEIEKAGDREGSRSARVAASKIVSALAERIADEELRSRYLGEPARAALRALEMPPAKGAAAGPLTALYRISEVITAPGDVAAMLSRVLDLALEIVKAERGLIILVDPDTEKQEVRAARGVEPETIADALEYSRSVVKEAAAGRTMLLLDSEADQQFRRYKSISLFHIKSLACVPMKVRDRIVGTVYLDSRRQGYLFGEDEMEFLKAFANLAAAALEIGRLNARLSSENVTLEREVQDLRKAAARRTRYQNIIGRNVRMQAIYDLLDRVSASNLPVLITGESGTGKELVARAIHFGGPRRDRRFFSENVAAIPDTLLESELFGHVRGAFTGADRDRKGVFELANGGTLFLDEIGDMSLPLQSKVLRALQEGEVRPVGGRDAVRVDVRIISATNRDIETMMREGRFREDLYYRLNVVRITVPPLRERKEDIPLLIEHFLERAAETAGVPRKRLDISALQLLVRYDWPGNVRELENEMMKLVVLTNGDVVTQQDIASHRELIDKLTRLEDDKEREAEGFQRLAQMEKRQIERALAKAGGNRAKAAQMLGISRATIYRKLQEFGISK